ncbi:AbrB family transcriptional regulator [Natronospirillum operosum]|uniref:AbrB family transcriptional regulator n=1 Tax=Natronospirillum operosum TaxID=2759953 RepID=A0A4Z0W5N2_9GAMM|nr:AbrB family transcriptional regulator [Natronospirillum operosum]TGG92400.1 AbrB family transcriptional regulator [Natronospirillum operosum]
MNRATPGERLIHGMKAALGSLVVAALGVGIFTLLGIPLPWLLGSLTATMLASMVGWGFRLPLVFRRTAMVILGLYAGSALDRELLSGLLEWPLTMTAMLVLVILSTWAASEYLQRRAGFDRATALMAAVPGAQSVVLVSCSRLGADERQVLLGQITRVITVIYGVPLLLITLGPWLDIDIADSERAMGASWPAFNATHWAMTVGFAVIGYLLARLLRLPQPLLLGPLFGVAALQMAQLPATEMPEQSLLAAQFLLGASIGSHFSHIGWRQALGILGHGFVAMLITLTLALLMTGLLVMVTDFDPAALFLAFAPGGLPEIMLLAMALDIDPAFVVFHHLFRFVAIALCLPWVVTRLAGRQ